MPVNGDATPHLLDPYKSLTSMPIKSPSFCPFIVHYRLEHFVPKPITARLANGPSTSEVFATYHLRRFAHLQSLFFSTRAGCGANQVSAVLRGEEFLYRPKPIHCFLQISHA